MILFVRRRSYLAIVYNRIKKEQRIKTPSINEYEFLLAPTDDFSNFFKEDLLKIESIYELSLVMTY